MIGESPDPAQQPIATRLRRLSSDELTADEVAAIRALMTAAFGDDEEDRFADADWEHALGGVHVLLEVAGRIVAHAAVVERELRTGATPLRTGYVEAVATAPDLQGTGLGTAVMREAAAIIAAEFELGALGTGSHHFYERLGWRTWRGASFVRTPDGDRATPDDDGYIMVRETPRTPPLDLASRISCEWRPGDVW
jgi:aminoglycoside 2'-N-acetyltransferase I